MPAQCPNCSAIYEYPDDSCWRCDVNLELACGDCGHGPYDMGAGVCFSCENVPKRIVLRPKRETAPA